MEEQEKEGKRRGIKRTSKGKVNKIGQEEVFFSSLLFRWEIKTLSMEQDSLLLAAATAAAASVRANSRRRA